MNVCDYLKSFLTRESKRHMTAAHHTVWPELKYSCSSLEGVSANALKEF